MVTERYEGVHGVQPGSLLAATAICAGLIGGLMLASPKFTKDVTRTLIGINIPIAQPSTTAQRRTPATPGGRRAVRVWRGA